MRKVLTGMIAAGALLAVSTGAAFAADYPPCKSRSDDKCMQVPAAPMKSEMKKEGGKMMEESGKMMKDGGSDIPRGCSPVTTPCQ